MKIFNQLNLLHYSTKSTVNQTKGFLKALPVKMKEVKFMVIDIETYLDSDYNHITYAVGIAYKEKGQIKSVTFYQADYNNDSIKQWNDVFEFLARPCFKGYKIYTHNLSNYDIVQIFKGYLSLNLKNPQVIPLYNTMGKLISVTIIYKERSLQFFDSLNLLTSSLDKLAKQFGLESKGEFPHKFASQENQNYVGVQPGKEYYYKEPTIFISLFDF